MGIENGTLPGSLQRQDRCSIPACSVLARAF